MSFDGRFLTRLVQELITTIQSGRIQKIVQVSKTDFLFVIRAKSITQKLLLSFSSGIGRIHLTKDSFDQSLPPSGFCMLLRKHLESGVIENLTTLDGDRILDITVSNINEMGELVLLHVICEWMGKYANLIVSDSNYKIIDSFIHISPFEESSRAIFKGLLYQAPKDEKFSPNEELAIQDWINHHPDFTPKDFIAIVRGTSPLFAKTLFDRFHQVGENREDVYSRLHHQATEPTLLLSDKPKFYYLNVFSDQNVKHYPTLCELLDDFYRDLTKTERIRQIGKNIAQVVKRDLDRALEKLEKLSVEYHTAKNNESFRLEADFLKNNQHLITKGLHSLTAFDYHTNTTRTVCLDPLLSASVQVQSAYKKYKKQKNAVVHLEKQIVLTQDQIEYYQQLQEQIELGDIFDIHEIANELNPAKESKPKPGKKSKPSHYDIYEDHWKNQYFVGKNNLQNEQLTHQVASSDDWWFHVQHQAGSHVIVKLTIPINEFIIRSAAQLASIYSNLRHSSSVPIDYTLIRNVKKIAHKPGFFVQYKNQKTIYIDPDLEWLNQLQKRK